MSLAPFFSRAADAAGPLLGGMSRSAVGERLTSTRIALRIAARHAELPGAQTGYLFAVNLASRLYPSLVLDAPEPLRARASAYARAINPEIDLESPAGDPPDAELVLGAGTAAARTVVVSARGWNAFVDPSRDESGPAAGPAAMAAAALGIGELFRVVFAAELRGRGRTGPAPHAFNLITLGSVEDAVPILGDLPIDLGTVHLAGAGAVGQAAAAALREVLVRGTLVVVDPQAIDLGNLQRYVLTVCDDRGRAKTKLVARMFEDHPLDVQSVPTPWGADERSGPGVDTALVALDTEQGRIDVAAGLPRVAYNAWTQAEDLGVSWHEAFGSLPCLACLYWPTGPRPSRLDLICEALGEHRLRVSPYLQVGLPVGSPLPAELISATRAIPVPPEAEAWTRRGLLEDVADRFGVEATELRDFASGTVDRLYREGVCAGILLEARDRGRHREVAVPLAHQSALAGILLASALLAARSPELAAFRPVDRTQARYDVLAGGAQELLRPRSRVPGCLCDDAAFAEFHCELWPTVLA